jgi:putative inorganic carbon (HCO3(-)) transporter
MEIFMMRDLALILMFLGFAWLAWTIPWVGALVMMVLAFMHPQGYADGGMHDVPFYLAMFGMVSLGTLVRYVRDRRIPCLPLDWRLFAIAALWSWFLVTTYYSLAPWAAWDKFREVLKILPTLLLVLLLIDTREKLKYLLITIALAVLLVALKGGYWAVMTGFNDRVYGPPGSPYHDNNAFAVIVAMVIPLLVLWLHESRDRALRVMLIAGIALCYGSIISSWSRGGMLTLGVVTLLLVLASRRKLLVLPLLVLMGTIFFVQLPETWFGRMETFHALQQDQSAQGRLTVWRVGLDNAMQYPVMGTGFDAWPGLTLGLGDLDWHSMYVEILVEHGFIGLALWALLLFGSLMHLSWLGWVADRVRHPWLGHHAAMLRASLAAYAVGGATLGITYWEQAYILIAATAILSKIGRVEISTSHGNQQRAAHPPQSPQNAPRACRNKLHFVSICPGWIAKLLIINNGIKLASQY